VPHTFLSSSGRSAGAFLSYLLWPPPSFFPHTISLSVSFNSLHHYIYTSSHYLKLQKVGRKGRSHILAPTLTPRGPPRRVPSLLLRSRRPQITRHRASTSMYSLTFRVRVMLPLQRNPCTDYPPNTVQLGGIPYHSPKLHPAPCNSVGMRPRTDRSTHRHTDRLTDRHTDARDHNTFRVVYDSREM